MAATFREGVVVEFVGEEILVLDSEKQTVHTFPSTYRGTVDALVSGRPSFNRDQVADLARRGLIQNASKTGLSRRAVLVGAGAVGATLAMPTAAVASSETFFVPDDLFEWFPGNDPNDTEVTNKRSLSPESIFIGNSSWRLTIGSRSATDNVRAGDGLDLLFNFTGFSPDLNEVLLGRLSGPNGELSNLFQISQKPIGPT